MSLIIPCTFLLTVERFPASTESPSSPARFWSQVVCFCIERALFTSLIISCAFLLTASVLKHQQNFIPIAGCPLRIPAPRWCSQMVRFSINESHSCPLHIFAHRECVSALTEFHPCRWSSPCAFLLTVSAFLCHPILIPVTDYPLCISAHSKCISHQQNLTHIADCTLRNSAH